MAREVPFQALGLFLVCSLPTKHTPWTCSSLL